MDFEFSEKSQEMQAKVRAFVEVLRECCEGMS